MLSAMFSHCVDLSTPPSSAGQAIAPTQLESEEYGSEAYADDDDADAQPPQGNPHAHMINMRERCDAIIASRPRTDDDPIVDVDSSGSSNNILNLIGYL